MASHAAGMSVSWNNSSIGEPVRISVSGASVDVVDVTGRNSGHIKQFEAGDADLGTVSVEAFGGGPTTGSLGQKGGLSVSGGGVSYYGQAIFAGLEIGCSVGDASRITYVFRMTG